NLVFAPNGETLYFTGFERDTLVLKRIGIDGSGEAMLYRFPNAVEAVPSPDLAWIAFREYHRSFVTPFNYEGQPVSISPFEPMGFPARTDPEDGHYWPWWADSRPLGWSGATGFYEKTVEQIMAESRNPPVVASGAAWNEARVPGSTARRTET